MTYAQSHAPKCWQLVIDPQTSFNGANLIVFPGTSTFTLINNTGPQDVQVQLNGDDEAQFTLQGNTSISFNNGELHLTSVDFANVGSGVSTADVQVIAGIVG